MDKVGVLRWDKSIDKIIYHRYSGDAIPKTKGAFTTQYSKKKMTRAVQQAGTLHPMKISLWEVIQSEVYEVDPPIRSCKVQKDS